MTAFKQILVAVDFSGPSKKAITYGLSLAEQFSAKLVLAHIVPESSALMYAFPTELPEIEKEQYATAKREIDKLVPAEYAVRVNLQTIVEIGDIEEQLLKIVADKGVDLVIMGTHGRRYFGRWFIGSVTEHILRKVPVPVLTVSHIKAEEHPIGPLPLKQILYATDLSESSNRGLQFAIELAQGTHGQLTVIHAVYDEDRMSWGPGLIAYVDRAKVILEIQKRLDHLIAQHNPLGLQIATVVVEGKPFKRIIETAIDRSIDIIVLNLQSKTMLERALLGSTAERVVRLAHIPVLSIPIAVDNSGHEKHGGFEPSSTFR